jgi:translation initiation factor 2 beta subunit (eIF-2beta)/eIF-5
MVKVCQTAQSQKRQTMTTYVVCDNCGYMVPKIHLESHRYYCQRHEYLGEIQTKNRLRDTKKKGTVLDAWFQDD